jgi:exodeoxyribonuclease VIII
MNAKKPSEESVKAIEFWRAFDAANAGKEILTGDEHRELTATLDALRAHPTARALVFGSRAIAQPSLFWEDPIHGVPCRARFDAVTPRDGTNENPDIIVDLKTAADAGPQDFGRAAFNFRYDVQAASDLRAWKETTGREAMFTFVVVRKSEPFLVAVYLASAQMLRVGLNRYLTDLAVYASCHASGEWPGYGDGVLDLELPAWAERINH